MGLFDGVTQASSSGSYDLFNTGLYWDNPVENTTYSFGGDIAPELGTSYYDLPLRDWSVQAGTRDTAGDVSGILGGIRATADGLLGAWSTVQGFQAQRDQLEIQKATASADKEVRLATIDAAKTRQVAEASVEKIKAQSAMERAANAAQGGIANYVAKTDALPYIIGAVAIGLVFFGSRRKGSK